MRLKIQLGRSIYPAADLDRLEKIAAAADDAIGMAECIAADGGTQFAPFRWAWIEPGQVDFDPAVPQAAGYDARGQRVFTAGREATPTEQQLAATAAVDRIYNLHVGARRKGSKRH